MWWGRSVVVVALGGGVVVPAARADFVVTTTASSGPGSLTQAIVDANATMEPDTITFAIGTGPQTIAGGVPDITAPVTIDGTTQLGFAAAGHPIIVVTGLGLPMGTNGIVLSGHDGSTIRGLVINGFSAGIRVESGSNGHTIAGNMIGTDVTGTVFVSNTYGVSTAGNRVTIGGTTVEDRNLISGNQAGVLVQAGEGAAIRGNLIGTTIDGNAGIGFGNTGVLLTSSVLGVDIGGTADGAGNLIAGASKGIILRGTNVHVYRNTFGVGLDDATPIPGNTGVQIETGATGAIVGGPGAGNVFAGQGLAGLFVPGPATGITVQGNRFGTNAAGTVSMPNGKGIWIGAGHPVTNVLIGGEAALEWNEIRNSTTAGVQLFSAIDSMSGLLVSPTSVRIAGNLFIGNGGLGIDLEGNGPTANDADDDDEGANGLQNTPVPTMAVVDAGMLTIEATLDTTADTTCDVEAYVSPAPDPSGSGEGAVPIGRVTVTTDGDGHAPVVFDVPDLMPTAAGQWVTLTATDADDETSEFSAALAIIAVTTTTSSSTSTSSTTSTSTSSTTSSSTTSTSATTTTSTSVASTTTSTTMPLVSSSTTTTTTSTTLVSACPPSGIEALVCGLDQLPPPACSSDEWPAKLGTALARLQVRAHAALGADPARRPKLVRKIAAGLRKLARTSAKFARRGQLVAPCSDAWPPALADLITLAAAPLRATTVSSARRRDASGFVTRSD